MFLDCQRTRSEQFGLRGLDVGYQQSMRAGRERSVSGRFAAQRSSLFLWHSLSALLPLKRFLECLLTAPLHFRSAQRSRALVVTDVIDARGDFVDVFQ